MLNPGESAFLVLCEELNFTRAADRCHMTQQGLSAHIRKLEEAYGTKLFLRVPKVALTETGRAVQETLLREESMNRDLLRNIREIDRGAAGSVRFGMNGARAAFVMPGILDGFCRNYPDVELHFITGDTRRLKQVLREGKLDGFLGVDAEPEPDIVIEPVIREKVYLIGRKDAFASFSPLEPKGVFPRYSLEEIAGQPGISFVRNSEGSTLNRLVDRALAGRGIRLKAMIGISDYNVQLSLCRNKGLFMFCPAGVALAEQGPFHVPDLMTAEPAEITEELEISIVTGAGRNYPACAKTFFSAVKKGYRRLLEGRMKGENENGAF